MVLLFYLNKCCDVKYSLVHYIFNYADLNIFSNSNIELIFSIHHFMRNVNAKSDLFLLLFKDNCANKCMNFSIDIGWLTDSDGIQLCLQLTFYIIIFLHFKNCLHLSIWEMDRKSH